MRVLVFIVAGGGVCVLDTAGGGVRGEKRVLKGPKARAGRMRVREAASKARAFVLDTSVVETRERGECVFLSARAARARHAARYAARRVGHVVYPIALTHHQEGRARHK